MSDQDKRAEEMPQRWKLERGPDGAWNTAQMTTTEDGEWCKAEDVAAALVQARREGKREGVEAFRDLAIQDWSAGKVYSRQTVNAWLRGLTARLLAKEEL